jgi:hypothetical protein
MPIAGGVFNAGDAIGFTRTGTTYRARVRVGGVWQTVITVTDASFPGPLYAAIWVQDFGVGGPGLLRLDDFTGGVHVAPDAHHVTHETGGSDALAHLDATIIDSGLLNTARLPPAVVLNTGSYTWPQAQKFQSVIEIESTSPLLLLTETDASANNKRWGIITEAETWFLRTFADAGGALQSLLTVTRAGALDVFGQLTVAGTNILTALGLKAPLASPALTGVPTAPTAAPGTNTTQLATTAFVAAKAPNAHHVSHETGGADALAALDAAILTTGTLPDARLSAAIARIASPAFTGNPTAPTPAPGDNDTSLATTAFVQAAVTPESGNWTANDQSGAGLVITSTFGTEKYRRINDIVIVAMNISYPVTSSPAQALIGGIPFPAAVLQYGLTITYTDFGAPFMAFVFGDKIFFYAYAGGAPITNAQLSGKSIRLGGFYFK